MNLADELYRKRQELLKEDVAPPFFDDWCKRYAALIQVLEFTLSEIGLTKQEFYKNKFEGEKNE